MSQDSAPLALSPQLQIASLRSLSTTKFVAAVLAISAAVVLFLFWIIYFKPEVESTSAWVAQLPSANAALNMLSSVFLVAGYVAVKRKRYAAHVRLMLAALGTSTLFLVSYLIYHFIHGDTKFLATGLVRPIYFFILISHILLSIVAVPLILCSFGFALAGKFRFHRAVSRFTFPVWLYVSVTGVLVFLMLRLFQPPG